MRECDGLYERQECRAAFRRAREFGVIYPEDEITEVEVHGRVLKVFGSPKSLALSKNTAFGHSCDDSLPWDFIPDDTDIIVTLRHATFQAIAIPITSCGKHLGACDISSYLAMCTHLTEPLSPSTTNLSSNTKLCEPSS